MHTNSEACCRPGSCLRTLLGPKRRSTLKGNATFGSSVMPGSSSRHVNIFTTSHGRWKDKQRLPAQICSFVLEQLGEHSFLYQLLRREPGQVKHTETPTSGAGQQDKEPIKLHEFQHQSLTSCCRTQKLRHLYLQCSARHWE